jgi:hypothetical protein
VFDLDAHDYQEYSKPIPIAMEPAGNADRLSNRARLQMVASILAMAVLRRKAGQSMNSNVLSAVEKSSLGSGEGLDLLGEQSVHA